MKLAVPFATSNMRTALYVFDIDVGVILDGPTASTCA